MEWLSALLSFKSSYYCYWGENGTSSFFYRRRFDAWMFWKVRVVGTMYSDCLFVKILIKFYVIWNRNFYSTQSIKLIKFNIYLKTSSEGFEPARAKPNWFLVNRLNHSATMTCNNNEIMRIYTLHTFLEV